MAPEILKGEYYTIKADIWSLGVILYEMLFGKTPFFGNNLQEYRKVIENTEIIFPQEYPLSVPT